MKYNTYICYRKVNRYAFSYIDYPCLNYMNYLFIITINFKF